MRLPGFAGCVHPIVHGPTRCANLLTSLPCPPPHPPSTCTVKLCYGLDGSERGMAGLPPPPGWHDWAARQLAKHGCLSAFPLSLGEVRWAEAVGHGCWASVKLAV